MKRTAHRHAAGVIASILGLFLIALLAGCGGGSAPVPSGDSSLSANDTNLIFVVTPDLANDPLGDINPETANLNNQGLQRSLQMASYLKHRLLGNNNVTGIYALAPMTHLQTRNHYPDMAAIGFIQQLALLNRVTVLGTSANSFPINAAYAPGDVPAGVVPPDPYIHEAQGLAFDDTGGNNAALAGRIIRAHVPGFYVFSAPWQTTAALLAGVQSASGYSLDLPQAYAGANTVYVISIAPSGETRLRTFDSHLQPPATYPSLPGPVQAAACTQQDYFSFSRTAGVNGVTVPDGINHNQTMYLVRHAEAHPTREFEDGNFVGAGQWRALSLANTLPGVLRGQGSPTAVYSVDPAQSFPILNVSYVRPSLTVFPYAVANNLPFHLAASFSINPDASSDSAAQNAMNYFFTSRSGVNLSNQIILLAWEHKHFPPLIQHLVAAYGGTVPAPVLTWPAPDYDTIWTVKLDSAGNLTVDNALCEGIDSSTLPATAPEF